MNIYMESPILKVTEIKEKTKAKLFKDLKVGDEIQLSIPVKSAGSNYGTYASYIEVCNVQTGEKTHKSFNQISPLLYNFEFKKECEPNE